MTGWCLQAQICDSAVARGQTRLSRGQAACKLLPRIAHVQTKLEREFRVCRRFRRFGRWTGHTKGLPGHQRTILTSLDAIPACSKGISGETRRCAALRLSPLDQSQDAAHIIPVCDFRSRAAAPFQPLSGILHRYRMRDR